MKKTIFLFILITVTIQNYAQEFAPVGAIWHFTQWTINPDLISFKTIESISDTTINGIQCRKMIEVELSKIIINEFKRVSKNLV